MPAEPRFRVRCKFEVVDNDLKTPYDNQVVDYFFTEEKAVKLAAKLEDIYNEGILHGKKEAIKPQD